MNERRIPELGISEDELIAILVVLFALLLGLFFFRGCNGGLNPIDGIELAEGDAVTIDTPIIADADFTGGEVEISGRAAAGDSVDVYIDGDYVGTDRADSNGAWALTTTRTDPGLYNVEANTRRDGQLLRSDLASFLIAGGAAAAVAGDDDVRPTVDLPIVRSGFEGGRVTITGECAPRSSVDVLIDNRLVGSTNANANGAWSFQTTEEEVGEHQVQVRCEGSNGNILQSIPYRFAVLGTGAAAVAAAAATDTPVPATATAEPAPTNTAVPEPTDEPTPEPTDEPTAAPTDEPTATPAPTAEPTAVPEPTAAPSPLLFAPLEFAPFTSGDGGASTMLMLTGEGEPGATIVLFVAGEEVGQTTVNDDGTWSFDLDELTLDAGEYGITAQMVDESGNELDIDGQVLVVPGTGSLAVLFGTSDSDPDADEIEEIAFGAPVVELILDSSWSMTFPLDSSEEEDRLTADDAGSRIAIAKGALIDLVENSLPESVPLALRVFGNRQGNLACQTTLEVPLSPLDRDNVVSVLEGVEPQFNANTALADSLARAGNDLLSATGPTTIVLLTDGAETCGGDPFTEISFLVDQGIDVQVDIVGFAIADDELRAEFESWAEVGGGTYYDARDVDSLIDALDSALNTSYRVLDSEGNEVASGIVGDDPVNVLPGEYNVQIRGLNYDVMIEEGQDTVLELK